MLSSQQSAVDVYAAPAIVAAKLDASSVHLVRRAGAAGLGVERGGVALEVLPVVELEVAAAAGPHGRRLPEAPTWPAVRCEEGLVNCCLLIAVNEFYGDQP